MRALRQWRHDRWLTPPVYPAVFIIATLATVPPTLQPTLDRWGAAAYDIQVIRTHNATPSIEYHPPSLSVDLRHRHEIHHPCNLRRDPRHRRSCSQPYHAILSANKAATTTLSPTLHPSARNLLHQQLVYTPHPREGRQPNFLIHLRCCQPFIYTQFYLLHAVLRSIPRLEHMTYQPTELAIGSANLSHPSQQPSTKPSRRTERKPSQRLTSRALDLWSNLLVTRLCVAVKPTRPPTSAPTLPPTASTVNSCCLVSAPKLNQKHCVRCLAAPVRELRVRHFA